MKRTASDLSSSSSSETITQVPPVPTTGDSPHERKVSRIEETSQYKVYTIPSYHFLNI